VGGGAGHIALRLIGGTTGQSLCARTLTAAVSRGCRLRSIRCERRLLQQRPCALRGPAGLCNGEILAVCGSAGHRLAAGTPARRNRSSASALRHQAVCGGGPLLLAACRRCCSVPRRPSLTLLLRTLQGQAGPQRARETQGRAPGMGAKATAHVLCARPLRCTVSLLLPPSGTQL
jgi:hypothetical protein